MGSWKHRKSERMRSLVVAIICFSVSIRACSASVENADAFRLDKELMTYVDEIFSVDTFKIMPGVGIEAKDANASRLCTGNASGRCRDADAGDARKLEDVDDYFYRKWDQYTENHVVAVNMSETSRFFKFETGKSSFLAGFGMGFLAFALKKLLLPVFIGAQIVKSILIAMFLPSILGSLGKVLGKGLSTFISNSGSSGGFSGGGGGGAQTVEDFEFKDTSPYNNDDPSQDYVAENTLTINTVNTAGTTSTPEAMNRFGFGNQRISYVNSLSDNYYIRQPNKKTDYKVFHRIPPSSLLLTTYDPFYSPLLSRLDSIFQQLGLGNIKSPETEKCRERLVCMMYANPAKYAPYSNLVSAQLSRELNELRKPMTDNPEILRFFRYMKAAKDGQDGEECLAHGGCSSLSAQQASPAMLTTYNDINKLVQARKMKT